MGLRLAIPHVVTTPTRRPALRRDLAVRPVHQNRRRLIEVSDPATGARLWLSELGYSVAYLLGGDDLDMVIALAKEALDSGRGVFDLVREKGWLSDEKLAEVLTPEAMTRPRPMPHAVET